MESTPLRYVMRVSRRMPVLAALFALTFHRLAGAQGAPNPSPTGGQEPAPAPPMPAPSPNPTLPAATRVEELDQRLRIVERRWEVDQEVLAEKKAEAQKDPPGVAVAY